MPAAASLNQVAAQIVEPRARPSATAGLYDSYSSSSSYGGGGGGYGSGGRGQREMFSATCSSCGKEAQVPFQPSGDKPVYCSDCFQQRGGNNRGGYGGRSGGRSRY